MFFDAHIHYGVCAQRGLLSSDCNPGLFDYNWRALSCAHSVEEWEIQQNAPKCVFRAFGIHPQLAGLVNINYYKDFLLELVRAGKLDAIGETGFDFFTDDFKATRNIQEDIWEFQVNLCIKYNLPAVVHCRKGNELLFRDSALLKKVPVVLFHSFMGSYIEANSLIKRGINCFFSFGKQIMNNNKKVIECVKNLPLDRLLFETDGPFQTLKGETDTVPCDIIKIYNVGYNIRNDKVFYNFDEFCEKIYGNGKILLYL